VIRLAVLPDFPEEGWPSMDLCAEMLLSNLPDEVRGERHCPGFTRLAGRVPWAGSGRAAFNADRLWNRHIRYPRFARGLRGIDAVHVVDHSYAHLIRSVRVRPAGVTCFDLDAFRCLIEPERDPRPAWFRAIAGRILAGLRAADVVFYTTGVIGAEIRRHRLVDESKLVHAPPGAASEYRPADRESTLTPEWIERLAGRPWLLHVGSSAPRKRLDVLLETFILARRSIPDLGLVKIGGEWSETLGRRMLEAGVEAAVTHVSSASRAELAAAYQRASLVLMPSDAEGFGLPVIEALACGAQVLASDIPSLREAGGEATRFLPVGDVNAWADAVVEAIRRPETLPSPASRLEQAGRFSWSRHARIIADTYRGLLVGSRR
jgi:glycosyltransferase involved in cell wall biosynthesis